MLKNKNKDNVYNYNFQNFLILIFFNFFCDISNLCSEQKKAHNHKTSQCD